MTRRWEHGHTRWGGRKRLSPTYQSWMGMKRRCYEEDSHNFPDYGGRGICVQETWMDSFSEFLQDMGVRPDGTTLDRIDSDGHYTKDNCRWATAREQALNKRNTVIVTHGGLTLTLYEWAERTGMKYGTLWSRIYIRGWSPEQALTKPADTRYRRK